jgi:hypothetical protein
MTSARNSILRHAWAVLLFGFLAVVWTYPLILNLDTSLPGAGAGDNVDVLWNFWWMRKAVALGTSFFHTPYLFAPVGMDLTLHTHSALPAFVGATLLAGMSTVAALNTTILVSMFMNGYCAWLLAWRLTKDHLSAVVAGIVFGGSPYLAAHLNGHFNLTAAWTIVVFALAVNETMRSKAGGWALAAGVSLGLTPYVDYYYVVYEGIIFLCLASSAAGTWSASQERPGPRRRRWSWILLALVSADAFVMLAIVFTGGFEATAGPVRLSVRGLFNPLQVFWVLTGLLVWLQTGLRVRWHKTNDESVRGVLRAGLIIVGAFAVVAAPLIWRAVLLASRGEFVAPSPSWRSGAGGVDLATLLLGNPFSGIFGGAARSAYRTFHIDPIESIGWLGIAPLLLAAWAIRSRALRQGLRGWPLVGAVFSILALGPHLKILGMNTGMPLPFAVLRYLPVISNARIPGRAIVVTYLVLALLVAAGLAELRRKTARVGTVVTAVVSLAVIADFFAAPFPLTSLDRPEIYLTLRDRPESGSLCELPLGLRDGFGEVGQWDDRVLFYQTIHERPITGGFVARLSPAIRAAYADDPLLAALLELSSAHVAEPLALPDRDASRERLHQDGIAFVMVNRAIASQALVAFVDEELPLRLIAKEGSRSLYVVAD